MENKVQNAPKSETQATPYEVPQPTTRASENPKPKSWLIITLIVLVLILLGTTGFLAYQNLQLKRQVLQTELTPRPVPITTEAPSPSPNPAKKGDCESNNQCPSGYYCEMRSDFLDIESPGTNIYGKCVKKSATCAKEGGNTNWVQGISCCEGLTSIPHSFQTSDSSSPKCITSRGGPSGGVCTKCGNKICGIGENICNCPEDCK